MDVFLNPLFWLAVVVAGGLYYLYLTWDKKRKGKSHKSVTNNQQVVEDSQKIPKRFDESEGDIPVIIHDNLMARWYEAHITEDTALGIIKGFQSLGRQWDYNGKKVFSLIRKKLNDGKMVLCPLQINSDIFYSSNEFYNDLQQPEIPIAMQHFMKADAKSLGDKVMEFLPWLVALGFLAFLWAFSK